MAANIKTYASSVLGKYNNSLNRLTARYIASISNIDTVFDLKNKTLEKEAAEKKNKQDAQSKIELKNINSSLYEKGLGNSGESVQAELDNNLKNATVMSAIEKEKEASKRANEAERTQSKNSAFSSYLSEVNSLEKERNDAYQSQLNKDREFEANREDEYYDRFVNNRDYEADRNDEYYDRFKDNRDYEADRSDEYYDRFADNRDYEADRSDENYDRYADSRDYEAERNDEKYDRYVESQTKEEEPEGTVKKEVSEEKKVEPDYNAKTLVDKIFTTYRSKYGKDEKKLYTTLSSSIKAIINDETLDDSYRYQVEIYAKALGYI